MTGGDLGTFAGMPVVAFDPEEPGSRPVGAIRLASQEWDASENQVVPLLESIGAQSWAGDVEAFVIGNWGASYETGSAEIVEWFKTNGSLLPKLRAVFLGDMTSEESEISWIQQSDVTPLLHTFPQLEELRVRGGTGLEFAATSHLNLRRLVFETGGLDASVVEGMSSSQLPALEHLEFWFGSEQYGANTSVGDIESLLQNPPAGLRYLGLRNAEFSNDIAAALATAPVVSQLEVLDLSMGTLTDDGLRALLAGQSLNHLTNLNLSQNFLTEAMRELLVSAGTTADTSGQDRPDEYDGGVEYYVSVAE